MKLTFYFDVYPWTKEKDDIHATRYIGSKILGATRYCINVEIKDPAQPDEIIVAQAIEVNEESK